jgi:hypothetical protein
MPAGTSADDAVRSIRQHTSAYVSICQHTSAYVSIRQHTSAYVSIRQHTSAYVSIRHTSAYVSIRQHTYACGDVGWRSSTRRSTTRALAGSCNPAATAAGEASPYNAPRLLSAYSSSGVSATRLDRSCSARTCHFLFFYFSCQCRGRRHVEMGFSASYSSEAVLREPVFFLSVSG